MEILFTAEEIKILSQESFKAPEEIAEAEEICRRKINEVLPGIKSLYSETLYEDSMLENFCSIEAYYLLYLMLSRSSWLRKEIDRLRKMQSREECLPRDFGHTEDYKKGTALAFRYFLHENTTSSQLL